MKQLFLLLFISFSLASSPSRAQTKMSEGTKKLATVMMLVENAYVDSVDDNKIAENAIVGLLENLDPHSSYLSKEDVADMNEPLEGNFEGIGIAFNIVTDTLYVIETISGGPSQAIGILPGDRIISVNDTLIAGVKMSTKDIMKKLKGKKGSQVKVQIKRRGQNDLLTFQIKRDKIPIYSLDASYMIEDSVGYIRLSRFGATTISEFRKALLKLKANGMQHLILDLAGNGGGYLGTATALANDFLGKDKLIVYMEGKHLPKIKDISTKKGAFENGRLVILIDENSASASEIVAGAVQDWDRGVIVGRRSFGKGLVQRQYPLLDGSMIRLTVSRYYTPAGRSIQKPYKGEPQKEYKRDLIDRYNRGEMVSADSIHFPDSLKVNTLLNKRIVYGGGGIMPDIFVPLDTMQFTNYSSKLIAYGTIYKIAMNEIDSKRTELLKKYPTIDVYKEKYHVTDALLKKLTTMGAEDSIKFDEEQFSRSKEMLRKGIKTLIGRDLYNTESYYKLINEDNEILKKGLEIIQNEKKYSKLLGK